MREKKRNGKPTEGLSYLKSSQGKRKEVEKTRKKERTGAVKNKRNPM